MSTEMIQAAICTHEQGSILRGGEEDGRIFFCGCPSAAVSGGKFKCHKRNRALK
jgi:hypothetical protein